MQTMINFMLYSKLNIRMYVIEEKQNITDIRINKDNKNIINISDPKVNLLF